MHCDPSPLCSRLLILKMACPKLLQIAVKTRSVHRNLAHLCSQMLILGLREGSTAKTQYFFTWGGMAGCQSRAPLSDTLIILRKDHVKTSVKIMYKKLREFGRAPKGMSPPLCTPLERFDHSGQGPFKNWCKNAMCESTVNTQGNCKWTPSPVAPLQPFAHSQNGMSSTTANSCQNAKCAP